MRTIASQLSLKISILSIVWMIAIVLFHSSNGVDVVWYKELMSDCRMGGAGFFFVVSGFLLMRRDGWMRPMEMLSLWKTAVRSRFRSLVVPCFIWCAIGLVVVLNCESNILNAFGVIGVASSANSPLWYVKFLFCFVLLSPLVALGIEKLGHWSFPSLAMGMLTAPFVPFPMKFSLSFSLACFVLGCVCARCPIRIPQGHKSMALSALLILVGEGMKLRINHPGSPALRMYGVFSDGLALADYSGKVCAAMHSEHQTVPYIFRILLAWVDSLGFAKGDFCHECCWRHMWCFRPLCDGGRSNAACRT